MQFLYLKASVARECSHQTRNEQIVDGEQNESKANALNSAPNGARQERKRCRNVHQSEDRQAQLDAEVHVGAQSLLRRDNIHDIHRNGDTSIE